MATPEEIAETEAAEAKKVEEAKIAAEAKAKAENTAAQEVTEEEPFDKDRAMKTIDKLRETEKQAKKDAKELADLKADAQKRADAELTESERLKKQADALAAENATIKADILRRDVIAETGLPDIFKDRLKGETKEELLADAKQLAETLPTLKAPPKLPANNPNAATQNENTEAAVREKLWPTGRLDAETMKRLGGGVVWNGKPLTKE